MKYIDLDGKQVGFPMPNTTYWQREVVRSQYPYGDSMGDEIKYTLYKATPVAVGISINIGVAAIVGLEAEVGAVLTLKGKNAGSVDHFATATRTQETDIKVGGGVKLKAIDTNNQKEFSSKLIEGTAKESSISVSRGTINGSLSKSVSSSKFGKITTNSLGLSKEFSVKNLIPGGNTLINLLKSINVSTGESKTKGFNTNSYKKDEEIKK